MLFNAQTLALAALFSTLVTGRPFDSSKPRNVVPRDKTYSVVNVGGDSSTPVPATATSVIETTKTVEVVGPGETVTEEVTATLEQRIKVLVFVDANIILVNTRTNNDFDFVTSRIFVNSQPVGTFINIDRNTNHLELGFK
ncbi:uncharacterized protein ALTATR162_LOCUS2090 [Alternaria atra]|uniref:Uncharacterized protein n=1 Tax=Alternaria atra TaxID=119953 RepID=A0A8J2MYH5_9PLEO|nr:uncharacterized protein ALTATR162_LOCUS2090 [Alternaria atra]CAG5147753.1 unnamed protein product [Alternaria atra]